MKDELFLIDTNVLVYAYETENSSKKRIAAKLLEKCFLKEVNLAVSAQNISEFIYVAIKKGKLSHDEARINAEDIVKFNGFRKIAYSPQTILHAIDMAKEFNMPFWDALLAATMKENHIYNIYTENIKDFRMPWINAVNPFQHQ